MELALEALVAPEDFGLAVPSSSQPGRCLRHAITESVWRGIVLLVQQQWPGVSPYARPQVKQGAGEPPGSWGGVRSLAGPHGRVHGVRARLVCTPAQAAQLYALAGPSRQLQLPGQQLPGAPAPLPLPSVSSLQRASGRDERRQVSHP